MSDRIGNLISTLQQRGLQGKWSQENMKLWRMTTPEEDESWFTPSGEELKSASDVADYVESLPDGGSLKKLLITAPCENWIGVEVQIQHTGKVDDWVAATIVDRDLTTSNSTKCLLQFHLSGEKRWEDLSAVRARWAPVLSNGIVSAKLANSPRTEIQSNQSSTDIVLGDISKYLVLTDENEVGIKLGFADHISRLRTRRLVDLCISAASVMERHSGALAENLLAWAKSINNILIHLEKQNDPTKEYEQRLDMSQRILSGIVSNAQIHKFKDEKWKVFFQPNLLDGRQAGSCELHFVSVYGEHIVGLGKLGSRFNALQLSIDEVDSMWCFYRCLDVIRCLELVVADL